MANGKRGKQKGKRFPGKGFPRGKVQPLQNVFTQLGIGPLRPKRSLTPEEKAIRRILGRRRYAFLETAIRAKLERRRRKKNMGEEIKHRLIVQFTQMTNQKIADELLKLTEREAQLSNEGGKCLDRLSRLAPRVPESSRLFRKAAIDYLRKIIETKECEMKMLAASLVVQIKTDRKFDGEARQQFNELFMKALTEASMYSIILSHENQLNAKIQSLYLEHKP
jgi:hypothetical protein